MMNLIEHGRAEPPSIEDSIEKLDKYPTVIERYYTQYHYTPESLPADETHCILVHSNRICLVTLAESHPIIAGRKKIAKIDFQVTDKVDRSEVVVRGKSKKGAQAMNQTSRLCFIQCEDNSRYTVFGCVKGKLIEVNSNLLNNFQLLVEEPLSNGFIAVILPNIKDIDEQKQRFQLIKSSIASQNESDLLEVDS